MSTREYVALNREIDLCILEARRNDQLKVRRVIKSIASFAVKVVIAMIIFLFIFWLMLGMPDEAWASPAKEPLADNEPKSFAVYEWNEDDEWVLLHIMQAEAGNQGAYGQALVGRVCINRLESGMWNAETLREVAEYRNQFSTVRSGAWYSEPNTDSYEALEMLRYGWDESNGAMYFRTVASGHFSWAEYLFTHGNHNFYR